MLPVGSRSKAAHPTFVILTGAFSILHLKWHPVTWRVSSNGYILHSLCIRRCFYCSKSKGADISCSQVLIGVSFRRLYQWINLLITCAKVTTTARERTATLGTSTPATEPFKTSSFADDFTEETQTKSDIAGNGDT